MNTKQLRIFFQACYKADISYLDHDQIQLCGFMLDAWSFAADQASQLFRKILQCVKSEVGSQFQMWLLGKQNIVAFL